MCIEKNWKEIQKAKVMITPLLILYEPFTRHGFCVYNQKKNEVISIFERET